jgi:hypothetical protein
MFSYIFVVVQLHLFVFVLTTVHIKTFYTIWPANQGMQMILKVVFV